MGLFVSRRTLDPLLGRIGQYRYQGRNQDQPTGAVHGTWGGTRSNMLAVATINHPATAPHRAAMARAFGGVTLIEPPEDALGKPAT